MEEGSEAYFFYYYKSNQYLSVYADDRMYHSIRLSIHATQKSQRWLTNEQTTSRSYLFVVISIT